MGTAVFHCQRAELGAEPGEGPAPASDALRALCARAYLGLGDKLAAAGARAEARARWARASELDPRLLDDPTFLARLASDVDPAGAPARQEPPAPSHHEHVPPGKNTGAGAPTPATAAPAEAADGRATEGAPATASEDAPSPPTDAGPRAERTVGVGLSTGFDGLLALSVAWLYRGRLAFEVSTGLLYRTLDTRVRFYGGQDALTPVLGLGLVTPFGAYGKQGRAGVRVERYESLYRVGQAMHVDLGLAWSVWKLDLFGGVAFLTSLDQHDDLRLLFFPQYAAQVLVYF